MSALYDELYANNPAFREYVNNNYVIENNGDKVTIHESLNKDKPTLKDKVFTFLVKQDDKNTQILDKITQKGRSVLMLIGFGLFMFVLYKLNLFKDIIKMLKGAR